MTEREMKQILDTEVPFGDLVKNSGIYEFYEHGDLSIGISYEADENGKDIYIFNLFCEGDYVNICSTGNNEETISELTATWNELENLLR